jgi:hypothetical protein
MQVQAGEGEGIWAATVMIGGYTDAIATEISPCGDGRNDEFHVLHTEHRL